MTALPFVRPYKMDRVAELRAMGIPIRAAQVLNVALLSPDGRVFGTVEKIHGNTIRALESRNMVCVVQRQPFAVLELVGAGLQLQREWGLSSWDPRRLNRRNVALLLEASLGDEEVFDAHVGVVGALDRLAEVLLGPERSGDPEARLMLAQAAIDFDCGYRVPGAVNDAAIPMLPPQDGDGSSHAEGQGE